MAETRKFDVYVYVYRTFAVRRWFESVFKASLNIELPFLQQMEDMKLLMKFCILLHAINAGDPSNEERYIPVFADTEEALEELITQICTLLGTGEDDVFSVADIVSHVGGFKVLSAIEKVINELVVQWNSFGDVQLPSLESMSEVMSTIPVGEITNEMVNSAVDEMGDISMIVNAKVTSSLKPKLDGIASYLKGDATALADASDVLRGFVLNMSLLPKELYIILLSLLFAAITKNYIFK